MVFPCIVVSHIGKNMNRNKYAMTPEVPERCNAIHVNTLARYALENRMSEMRTKNSFVPHSRAMFCAAMYDTKGVIQKVFILILPVIFYYECHKGIQRI